MVVGVRPAGVVEAGDIGEKTLLELIKGLEAAPVQLLFFQILEKALHDSVVIGVAFGRKGLDHSQIINDHSVCEEYGDAGSICTLNGGQLYGSYLLRRR